MLAAVLDPAHRVIELQRKRRQDDFLGVKSRLRAKPAADIGRNDANGALINAQILGNRDPHHMRRLGRGIDHDFIEPMVAIGEHSTPFERSARLPVHAVAACHSDLGRAGSGLNVAAFGRPLEIEIVARVLVDESNAAVHIADGVDHRVEYLVFDHDRGSQVLGLAPYWGDADSDGLADIAHFVDGQRRPSRRLGAWRLRGDPNRLKRRQIDGREDPPGGLGRDSDRLDPGMRVGAPQEGDLHGARQFDVGHELAATMQVAFVLAAQEGGADSPSLIRH